MESSTECSDVHLQGLGCSAGGALDLRAALGFHACYHRNEPILENQRMEGLPALPNRLAPSNDLAAGHPHHGWRRCLAFGPKAASAIAASVATGGRLGKWGRALCPLRFGGRLYLAGLKVFPLPLPPADLPPQFSPASARQPLPCFCLPSPAELKASLSLRVVEGVFSELLTWDGPSMLVVVPRSILAFASLLPFLCLFPPPGFPPAPSRELCTRPSSFFRLWVAGSLQRSLPFGYMGSVVSLLISLTGRM